MNRYIIPAQNQIDMNTNIITIPFMLKLLDFLRYKTDGTTTMGLQRIQNFSNFIFSLDLTAHHWRFQILR